MLEWKHRASCANVSQSSWWVLLGATPNSCRAMESCIGRKMFTDHEGGVCGAEGCPSVNSWEVIGPDVEVCFDYRIPQSPVRYVSFSLIQPPVPS